MRLRRQHQELIPNTHKAKKISFQIRNYTQKVPDPHFNTYSDPSHFGGVVPEHSLKEIHKQLTSPPFLRSSNKV